MPLRLAVSLLLAGPLWAELTSIDIHKREPFDKGRAFGAIGAYEQIEGVMRFAADPSAPANKAIIDIERAPVNARGLVEFEADFLLVRPADPARGNGALLFDVVNRGNFRWHSTAFRTPESPDTSARFLLERGFTVLAIGWQHDVPTSSGGERLLRAKVPIATDKGKPIRGLVAVTFTLDTPARRQRLSDRGHLPYLVSDANSPDARMTVRYLDGRSETVPRAKWRFGADRGSVEIDGGFLAGHTYEVVLPSENPPVTGLGFAAVRDGVMAVKLGKPESLGVRSGMFDRALAVGQSQSGRFLRGFVHEGFNAAPGGGRVFDGMLSIIAGASRVTTNYRFAQPSLNPGLFFPFTDGEQTDPVTGESGGLLSRLPAAARPKMMYLNTANEYWRSSAAALVHTSLDGRADVPPPADTRLYVVAGAQHGPGAWPPRKGELDMAPNPLNYRWVTRAALLALDRWVSGKGEPPPNRYPRIDQGELVESSRLGFPAIPGVTVAPSGQTMARAKVAPDFRVAGPITVLPPRPGAEYPLLVSRVNADGNETGGIVLPELAVPLGTYTGWNQRFPGAKDMNASLGLVGGFVPFPRDGADRQAKRDPRRSLAERYSSREQFLGMMAEAALRSAREGYVLDEDVASLLRAARRQYDDMTAGSARKAR